MILETFLSRTTISGAKKIRGRQLMISFFVLEITNLEFLKYAENIAIFFRKSDSLFKNDVIFSYKSLHQYTIVATTAATTITPDSIAATAAAYYCHSLL